jgi:2-phospho-L-lactate/phosphoenolpyruvate guanylyltransferase
MTRAVPWIIVPVKSLGEAKQRLAPVLPPEARRELVLAMLEVVLGAVGESGGNGRVLVVTPDPEAARLAESMGVKVLRERRSRGLNAAVRAGLGAASSRGAAQALVLPADVPLAGPDELGVLLEKASDGAARVTLVPAADGDGTNAMLLGPPDALEPSFGPGSYVRHLSQAVARRLDVQVLHLPGLAADIDQPADLHRLLGPDPRLARFQFLAPHVMKAEIREPAPGADGR